jgi:MFS family permease
MHYSNLGILFFCQLVSVSGSIIFATIGGIVGSSLASDPALATLPITLMIIGTALSTVPATMVMKRTSRRFGFCLAAFIACCAMLLAAYALQSSSYFLFCIATGSFGFNMAFAQQYRFAAAESVSLEKAGMAISLVLVGAIGGAILGPSLLIHSKSWIVDTPYVGGLLVLAGLFLLTIITLLGLQEPQINKESETNALQRDLGVIIRNPVYKVAVLGGIVGYGVMTLIMTATPLSMHVIDGFSMQETVFVVRSHVLAMYAPSLVSAYLISKLGEPKMMLIGALAMTITVIVGSLGHEMIYYWSTLVLLGLGWNLLYIGGTTLLTRCYTQSERFKAQAVNEFSVFGVAAAASLIAGPITHYFGWEILMIIVIPVLLVMLLGLYQISHSQP